MKLIKSQRRLRVRFLYWFWKIAAVDRQNLDLLLVLLVIVDTLLSATVATTLFYGRPFVKRFAYAIRPLSCLSVCPVCLFCLCVTLVYCSQTVGRIKMKRGTQVGLGPGHIALDGDPAPSSPKKGQSPPIFDLCLLCPNGCMDQDATWYGGRPRPRPHGARWEPDSPSPKRGQSPNFRPVSIVAKRLDG